jgi:hypothetical protein
MMMREASEALSARNTRHRISSRWAPPPAASPPSHLAALPEVLPLGERLVWPRWLSIGIPTEEPTRTATPPTRSTTTARRTASMLAHL